MVNGELLSNETYFTNCYSLKFANRHLAEKYEKRDRNKFPKKAIIFSIVYLILSTLILVLHIRYAMDLEHEDTSDLSSDQLKEQKEKLTLCNKLLPLSYFILSISALAFFITLLRIKYSSLYKCCDFFIFLSISSITTTFVIILYTLDKPYYHIPACVETISKCVYIAIGRCSFIDVFIISLFTVPYMGGLGSFVSLPLPSILTSTAMNVCIIFLAYLLEKRHKILFYYKWKISKKNEWLKSTLDNIQNGLVVIDKHKLHYYNEYVRKNLPFLLEQEDNREEYVKKRDRTPSIILQYDKTKRMKKSLTFNTPPHMIDDYIYCELPVSHDMEKLYLNRLTLKNLEDVNPDLPYNVIDSLNDSEFLLSDILEIIEKDKKLTNTFEDFKFLGTKTFLNKSVINSNSNFNSNCNIKTVLEIFLRVVEKEDNKIAFEFIFNDVTRSKITEEAKAQIKYKSLFVAKVAHEFKNPIIIIKELVDQIMEELPDNLEGSKVIDNLILSKNLSSYLLILVKDFEVISKQENSTKIEMIKTLFDLKEEMDFLQQIVQSLIIKKYGEVDLCPIRFNIEINQDVPENIYTDSMRLLQVLINLLSNSIKFTNSGDISLIVENSETIGKIRFTVKDQGKGIPQGEVIHLFKNFYKTGDNNPYGSGLGLSIAKELSTLLGGQINFSHNIPSGCIFSFEIDSIMKEAETNYKDKSALNDLSPHISHIANESYNLSDNSSTRHLKLISRKSHHSIKEKSCYYKKMSTQMEKDEEDIITDINPENKRIKPKFELPQLDYNNEDSFISIITNSAQSQKDLPICIHRNDSSNIKLCKGISNQGTINLCASQISNLMILNNPLRSSFDYLNFKTCKFNHHIPAIYNKSGILCRTFIYKSCDDDTIQNQQNKNRYLNIIVADDDTFIRKALIRHLDKYLSSLNLNLELKLVEATDGIEALYAVYSSFLHQNLQIDLIITDETMMYMSGSHLSQVLSKMFSNRIPVAIVSAYEDNINKSQYSADCICGIFSKPVNKKIFSQIFKTSKILCKFKLTD